MTEHEAKQLLADKQWRLSHLYKIRTTDARLVTLKPNRAQLDYLSKRDLWNLILKVRQLGFTTISEIDALDDTITTPNISTAIIAHETDKVHKLFEIVRLAYDELPDLLRPKAQYDNRNELYFPELTSKIFVALDTRGETVQRLHVSEVAFIKDADTRMPGILESVPQGGRVSFESTANGTSGIFYDTWNDSKTRFKKPFCNWLWEDGYQEPTDRSFDDLLNAYAGLVHKYGLIPDLVNRFQVTQEQLNWYLGKIHSLKHLVVQEYPTTPLEAFIASGRNVFHISDLQKHVISDPIARKWQDLLIWEQPLEGFKYVIGVDPSEGVGQDNSVTEVLNAHTGEQAAEFATNNCPPDTLADYCMEIGNYYNKACIVPEVNNHGISLLDKMKGRYGNIYRRQVMDQHSKEYHDALGWKTTGTTKPLLIDDLEEAIRDESIHLHSEDALKECKTFVRTDDQGKQGFGAEGSNKDDRVIALGLCRQGMKEIPGMKMPKSAAQKRLEEYIKAKQLAPYQDQPVMNRFNRNYKIRK